nr:MAG TPA: hypothetical protein [Caudoviricetes sp.]
MILLLSKRNQADCFVDRFVLLNVINIVIHWWFDFAYHIILRISVYKRSNLFFNTISVI